jgi:hypothetical protein
LHGDADEGKYRGMYRVGDQRVGLWSNDVSLTVGL